MAYAHSSRPIRRAAPARESTRITLARVLDLGVRVSWREASAIVHEAIARAATTEGAGPARVTAESCVITRGGDVLLAGTAAQARPEAVVHLLDELLAACSEPGRFAGAVAAGTALDMLEELAQHTSPKRRQVEVASVALRGLVAAADAARAMADGAEHPSAAGDRLVAAARASRLAAGCSATVAHGLCASSGKPDRAVRALSGLSPDRRANQNAGTAASHRARDGQRCQGRRPIALRPAETRQRGGARGSDPHGGCGRVPGASDAGRAAVGGRGVRAGDRTVRAVRVVGADSPAVRGVCAGRGDCAAVAPGADRRERSARRGSLRRVGSAARRQARDACRAPGTGRGVWLAIRPGRRRRRPRARSCE